MSGSTTGKKFTVHDILKDSSKEFGLKLFTEDEIGALEFFEKKGKPYLTCLASDKDRPAKPEEVIRFIRL